MIQSTSDTIDIWGDANAVSADCQTFTVDDLCLAQPFEWNALAGHLVTLSTPHGLTLAST